MGGGLCIAGISNELRLICHAVGWPDLQLRVPSRSSKHLRVPSRSSRHPYTIILPIQQQQNQNRPHSPPTYATEDGNVPHVVKHAAAVRSVVVGVQACRQAQMAEGIGALAGRTHLLGS